MEDHLFGDKEKFVTAAYKKKLQEDQQWLAEEKVREAKEAEFDVVKTGHMGNFYRWSWDVVLCTLWAGMKLAMQGPQKQEEARGAL